MKRRRFMGLAAAAGLGLAARPATADMPAEPTAADDGGTIDPYFLDRGDVTDAEQASIEAYLDYQGRAAEGLPAILPRGGKPKRAPTFRFLHWRGDLGDPDGRLVGPLSVKPTVDAASAYHVNAQILGFRTSTRDWSGKTGQGTLTIEMRARHQGEPMTWLYLQQFEVVKGGGNSVGMEFVAQREGLPDPVVSEQPTMDLRIQLMRHRKAPGVLRKILKVGSFLSGAPVQGFAGGTPSFNDSPPAMRVPRMVQEGVAFAQATVGGMAEEAPIWRGGFTTFSVSTGGSRLALTPGLWVALDDSQEIDYTGLKLEDLGGSVGLVRKGKPVDLNYLVLAFEISAVGARGEIRPKGGGA